MLVQLNQLLQSHQTSSIVHGFLLLSVASLILPFKDPTGCVTDERGVTICTDVFGWIHPAFYAIGLALIILFVYWVARITLSLIVKGRSSQQATIS